MCQGTDIRAHLALMMGVLTPILQMARGLEMYQMPSMCPAFACRSGIFHPLCNEKLLSRYYR